MKTIQLYKLFVIAALAGLNLGCQKYLNLSPPNNQVATNSVFTDSISADLALTGIYASLVGSNEGLIAVQSRWMGLYADELGYTQPVETIRQFSTNSLQIDNPYLNSLWIELYKHIYQANSVIEGVIGSTAIAEETKLKLIGEAKFIRAFLLFYAVNNWGDVPLTLTTDYRENEKMPRTPKDLVYQQIIDDLTDAFNNLGNDYDVPNRVRPNKWTAGALLARVYLYIGDWDNTVRVATDVIGSGVFQLESLSDAFKMESHETIWQIFPSTIQATTNTPDGLAFIPSSLTNETLPIYPISAELYDSFEDGDARRSDWIGTKIIGSIPYYFPHKYKVRINRERSEYPIVFRFAELYLIRAEAYAMQKKFHAAKEDINIIRSRAGLDILDGGVADIELVQAIEDERRHELFTEWGHRFYDLKRTNRVDAVLSTVKGSQWDTHKPLWPIPLPQLLANPFLHQNDGYE